ncbi:hypothetical protein TWF225_004216 [Orbilia oligospora]|uniref:Uncharacterized protein n=1 Tax=Orbilia oligospora TaxID=2813651 RepID=A0A7C8PFH2_ORBOL|nr:hypothetical protein TWF751_006713 [Orbilia oligospora]KAF3187510.1 hypothetical protein TWF225_004216 [Orbilia oligospora]KAF3245163.1 hypothetical protein TWF128_009554 [Orbilia oligospora]KAF3272810.1 hypothetical protein TWF217_000271 [Orbilia oligospora]KAF3287082.1 hypothetical protein TWF132_008764 [Orbilia oligospora]
MKESLLTQLKRNLSNRSRKGKEPHVQRPETPKFLDVDGDARSTYSVESDSKSFFSFSFENAESTSLCDFETTAAAAVAANDGAKPTRKLSFEKSPVDVEGSPPPYDVDQLEWILFYPRGVGKHFVGMLGINDVVAMSQVCRAWRRWLVPERDFVDVDVEKSDNPQWNMSSFLPSIKTGPQWHPLVQTVIASNPPSQGTRDFIEPLGFYGRYHRQSILHWQKYEFSIPRLLGVFGENYLSAITSLHLDGAGLDTKSDWLRYCANLESLSIRRCAGITLDRLVDLVLGPEDENSASSSKKKKQKSAYHTPRPEKLRVVRFWGIDGARQLAYPHNSDQYISDRHKLEKYCDRLMDRFETDVWWGLGGDMTARDWNKRYRLLISMEEKCGVCGKARKHSGWPDGVSCERCLGFNCWGCMNMKIVSRADASSEDHDLSNASAVNMLRLVCNQEGICGWEAGEHHVHPECIPPATLLWGHNDPLKHVFELYAHLQRK